jgi:epsilon-lactone hydrolase
VWGKSGTAGARHQLRVLTSHCIATKNGEDIIATRQSEQLIRLYKGFIAALEVNPEMPIDELRALLGHMGDVTGEPGAVDYIETDAAGVPALWAVPKRCVEDRVLLCSHGGGYVVGSMFTHRKLYGHLAKAVGCRALIVHYGLAPEHVHPGPVNDMASAYRWLLEQGITPNHIALTGGRGARTARCVGAPEARAGG